MANEELKLKKEIVVLCQQLDPFRPIKEYPALIKELTGMEPKPHMLKWIIKMLNIKLRNKKGI